MFRFQQNRLQLKQRLGRGRFGAVFPYQKDPQDTKWVVKRIKADDSDMLVTFLPEIVLGFACEHPHVVPVKGYFIEKDADDVGYNIYMKLPRMKENLLGDWKERERKNSPYTEQEIIRHFYSLVCGINYLHNRKIYHRDIKPDNLLLDSNGILRIGDVGIAKHVEDEESYQTLTGAIGTCRYSAPEILGAKQEKPRKETLAKADIWSIGCVILELCAFDLKLLNSSLSRDELQILLDDLFKSLEGKYQGSLMSLLKRIMRLNPEERPGMEQIKAGLEKEFSQIIDKELVNNQISIHEDHGPEVAELNQKIQEMNKVLEESEAEKSQLKKIITELENKLVQQNQQHEERIKVMVGQSESRAREHLSEQETDSHLKIKELERELNQLRTERQEQSNIIANTNTKLRNFEERIQISKQEKTHYIQRSSELQKELDQMKTERQRQSNGAATTEAKLKNLEDQVRNLDREKTFYEQKNKELETYLATTIKEQMEAYEAKIKDLQESEQKGKRELEAQIAQNPRESFGEDYEKTLDIVVLELNNKWKEKNFFEIRADCNTLQIYPPYTDTKKKMKDCDVDELSKDIIKTLKDNNLLNLFGLKLVLNDHYWDILTDSAFQHFAEAILSEPVRFQSLHLFLSSSKMTDQTLVEVAKVISSQPYLSDLSLDFHWLKKITDSGIEDLATAIEKTCPNLQQLNLSFRSFDRNQITVEKIKSLRKRFAHIPKLYIE